MAIVSSEMVFVQNIISTIKDSSDLLNVKHLDIECEDEFLARFIFFKLNPILEQLGQQMSCILQKSLPIGQGSITFKVKLPFKPLESLLKSHSITVREGTAALSIEASKTKEIATSSFGEVALLKYEVEFYKKRAKSFENNYNKACKLLIFFMVFSKNCMAMLKKFQVSLALQDLGFRFACQISNTRTNQIERERNGLRRQCALLSFNIIQTAQVYEELREENLELKESQANIVITLDPREAQRQ